MSTTSVWKKSGRYNYNRQNVSKKRWSLKMLVQHLPPMGHPGEVTSICLVNLWHDPMLYVHFLFFPTGPKDTACLLPVLIISCTESYSQIIQKELEKFIKENGKRFTTRMCLRHIHAINHRSLNWPVSKQLFSKISSLCFSYQELLHEHF